MLVDPALSGLPAFLTPRPGLNSGFMIPQVTAAALVSENKQRAHPASVDSIPTSANQEDHVSMAAHGARRLMEMADNAGAVIGIELLAAAQGCDFHRAADVEPAARSGARRCCAREVPHLDEDRYLPSRPCRRRLAWSAAAPSSTAAGTHACRLLLPEDSHDPHRQQPAPIRAPHGTDAHRPRAG